MYKWNKPEDIVSSKVDFWILFSSVKEKLINQPLCTCVNHSVQKKTSLQMYCCYFKKLWIWVHFYSVKTNAKIDTLYLY